MQALQLKGVSVGTNDRYTFRDLAAKIRGISTSVTMQGITAASIEYGYHRHSNSTASDVYWTTDSGWTQPSYNPVQPTKGGCFTEPVIHHHENTNPHATEVGKVYGCYKLMNYCNGWIVCTEGFEHGRYYGHCPKCGKYATDSDTTGFTCDTRTWQEVCGHAEGELVGYARTCRFCDGQIVDVMIKY